MFKTNRAPSLSLQKSNYVYVFRITFHFFNVINWLFSIRRCSVQDSCFFRLSGYCYLSIIHRCFSVSLVFSPSLHAFLGRKFFVFVILFFDPSRDSYVSTTLRYVKVLGIVITGISHSLLARCACHMVITSATGFHYFFIV